MKSADMSLAADVPTKLLLTTKQASKSHPESPGRPHQSDHSRQSRRSAPPALQNAGPAAATGFALIPPLN